MLEIIKKIQKQIENLKKRFQIKFSDSNLSGNAECCQVFGINSTNGNFYYKDSNGQWVLKTIGSGGGFFDAIVDFSVNADPNTVGTTFSPNSPALTTVLYVSTIDNSQWTYNGTNYVTYNAPFWTIRGNIGTTPGTHFVGTLDDTNLVFKTNNENSGLIDRQSFNTALGVSSLSIVSSGAQNTTFGYSSGSSITSGDGNTAIGSVSQELNLSGNFNTTIGFNSLHSNVSNSNNTALGADALYQCTGDNNIGIGFKAGAYATTSTSNKIFINSLDRINVNGDKTLSPIYIEQNTLLQNQNIFLNGLMNLSYVPTFSDNASALLGGLVSGNIYKIPIGGGTFNLAIVV